MLKSQCSPLKRLTNNKRTTFLQPKNQIQFLKNNNNTQQDDHLILRQISQKIQQSQQLMQNPNLQYLNQSLLCDNNHKKLYNHKENKYRTQVIKQSLQNKKNKDTNKQDHFKNKNTNTSTIKTQSNSLTSLNKPINNENAKLNFNQNQQIFANNSKNHQKHVRNHKSTLRQTQILLQNQYNNPRIPIAIIANLQQQMKSKFGRTQKNISTQYQFNQDFSLFLNNNYLKKYYPKSQTIFQTCLKKIMQVNKDYFLKRQPVINPSHQRQSFSTLFQWIYQRLMNLQESIQKLQINSQMAYEQQKKILLSTFDQFSIMLQKQCVQKGMIMKLLNQHFVRRSNLQFQYLNKKAQNQLQKYIELNTQTVMKYQKQKAQLYCQINIMKKEKQNKWRNMFMFIKDNRVLRRQKGKLIRSYRKEVNQVKSLQEEILKIQRENQKYRLLFDTYEDQESDKIKKYIKTQIQIQKLQKLIQKYPRKAKKALSNDLEKLQTDQLKTLQQKIGFIIKTINQANVILDEAADLQEYDQNQQKLCFNAFTQTQVETKQKGNFYNFYDTIQKIQNGVQLQYMGQLDIVSYTIDQVIKNKRKARIAQQLDPKQMKNQQLSYNKFDDNQIIRKLMPKVMISTTRTNNKKNTLQGKRQNSMSSKQRQNRGNRNSLQVTNSNLKSLQNNTPNISKNNSNLINNQTINKKNKIDNINGNNEKQKDCQSMKDLISKINKIQNNVFSMTINQCFNISTPNHNKFNRSSSINSNNSKQGNNKSILKRKQFQMDDKQKSRFYNQLHKKTTTIQIQKEAITNSQIKQSITYNIANDLKLSQQNSNILSLNNTVNNQKISSRKIQSYLIIDQQQSQKQNLRKNSKMQNRKSVNKPRQINDKQIQYKKSKMLTQHLNHYNANEIQNQRLKNQNQDKQLIERYQQKRDSKLKIRRNNSKSSNLRFSVMQFHSMNKQLILQGIQAIQGNAQISQKNKKIKKQQLLSSSSSSVQSNLQSKKQHQIIQNQIKIKQRKKNDEIRKSIQQNISQISQKEQDSIIYKVVSNSSRKILKNSSVQIDPSVFQDLQYNQYNNFKKLQRGQLQENQKVLPQRNQKQLALNSSYSNYSKNNNYEKYHQHSIWNAPSCSDFLSQYDSQMSKSQMNFKKGFANKINLNKNNSIRSSFTHNESHENTGKREFQNQSQLKKSHKKSSHKHFLSGIQFKNDQIKKLSNQYYAGNLGRYSSIGKQSLLFKGGQFDLIAQKSQAQNCISDKQSQQFNENEFSEKFANQLNKSKSNNKMRNNVSTSSRQNFQLKHKNMLKKVLTQHNENIQYNQNEIINKQKESTIQNRSFDNYHQVGKQRISKNSLSGFLINKNIKNNKNGLKKYQFTQNGSRDAKSNHNTIQNVKRQSKKRNHNLSILKAPNGQHIRHYTEASSKNIEDQNLNGISENNNNLSNQQKSFHNQQPATNNLNTKAPFFTSNHQFQRFLIKINKMILTRKKQILYNNSNNDSTSNLTFKQFLTSQIKFQYGGINQYKKFINSLNTFVIQNNFKEFTINVLNNNQDLPSINQKNEKFKSPERVIIGVDKYCRQKQNTLQQKGALNQIQYNTLDPSLALKQTAINLSPFSSESHFSPLSPIGLNALSARIPFNNVPVKNNENSLLNQLPTSTQKYLHLNNLLLSLKILLDSRGILPQTYLNQLLKIYTILLEKCILKNSGNSYQKSSHSSPFLIYKIDIKYARIVIKSILEKFYMRQQTIQEIIDSFKFLTPYSNYNNNYTINIINNLIDIFECFLAIQSVIRISSGLRDPSHITFNHSKFNYLINQYGIFTSKPSQLMQFMNQISSNLTNRPIISFGMMKQIMNLFSVYRWVYSSKEMSNDYENNGYDLRYNMQSECYGNNNKINQQNQSKDKKHKSYNYNGKSKYNKKKNGSHKNLPYNGFYYNCKIFEMNIQAKLKKECLDKNKIVTIISQDIKTSINNSHNVNTNNCYSSSGFCQIDNSYFSSLSFNQYFKTEKYLHLARLKLFTKNINFNLNTENIQSSPKNIINNNHSNQIFEEYQNNHSIPLHHFHLYCIQYKWQQMINIIDTIERQYRLYFGIYLQTQILQYFDKLFFSDQFKMKSSLNSLNTSKKSSCADIKQIQQEKQEEIIKINKSQDSEKYYKYTMASSIPWLLHQTKQEIQLNNRTKKPLNKYLLMLTRIVNQIIYVNQQIIGSKYSHSNINKRVVEKKVESLISSELLLLNFQYTKLKLSGQKLEIKKIGLQ